jgi:ergothioneine biosynthesis protein EgtB
VEEHVARHLERGTLAPELLVLLELGIQHEQQHQELLLTDIGHAFSVHPLLPAYVEHPLALLPAAEPLEFSGFEAAQHWMGAEGPGFAFDNEGPRHRVWLEAFEIAHRPVTNGEYLELVRAGGYREPALWLSDGWAEVAERGLERPAYWHERDGEPFEMSLSGLVPLDLAAPVCHLSYYEADAYATFAGARLPSEAEWEVAAQRFADAPSGQWLESGRLHPGIADPAAADAPPGAGPRSFLGDVWEWTRSAYAAYPGYRRAPGALGEYNGKFMCGQQVLRGGSCLSPESHLRASYRNFFAPGASWQMSGLRLARDRG